MNSPPQNEPLCVGDEYIAGIPIYLGATPDEGRHVATVFRGTSFDREALARLFGAAPDLLAALRELRDSGLLNIYATTDSRYTSRMEAASSVARNAIAKAEGRS